MSLQLTSHLPPHDPNALAREILAQRRFRIRVQAPSGHTWWDTIRTWIGDRWNQLMDAFSHHVHVGARWSLAWGDLLIVALIVLVIVVVVRLLLSMAGESGSSAGVRGTALPVHAGARELQAAAVDAAQAGAFTLAIALLFQATLALLDARGLLRDDPARTVNECRSDVRSRAASLSASFDRIARIFTAAIYAEDRMTSAQWEQACEAYGALTTLQNHAA